MQIEKLTDLQRVSINTIRKSAKAKKPILLQLPTGFGKTRVSLKAFLSSTLKNKRTKLIVIRKKNFHEAICPWTGELNKLGALNRAILTTHRKFKEQKTVRELINLRNLIRKSSGYNLTIILDESHRAFWLAKKLLAIKENSTRVNIIFVSATPANPVTAPFADNAAEAQKLKEQHDQLVSLGDGFIQVPEALSELKADCAMTEDKCKTLTSDSGSFKMLSQFHREVKLNARTAIVRELNFLAGKSFPKLPNFESKNLATIRFLDHKIKSGEKVLIFCHFLNSAQSLFDYLKPRLKSAVAYANAAGGDRAIQCFAGSCHLDGCASCGNLKVLIVTDRHSESIDLHRECRVMLHYELYWSPTVMAQRVGRLWRLGHKGFKKNSQQRPSFPEVYHIKTPHSIEMEIFVRLSKRLDNIHKYGSFTYLDLRHIVGDDLNSHAFEP